MAELANIIQRYEALKRTFVERDKKMARVTAVRNGDISSLAPGLFPEAWPKPVVANFVDIAARDLAEVIAPLPAVNCNPSDVVDDNSRTRANKRTKIANYYMEASRLATTMYTGADSYLTYGFLPFRIEANLDEGRPHIHVESPVGGYPEYDRWGNVIAYGKRWIMPAGTLAAQYPEFYRQILGDAGDARDRMVELVRWSDEESTSMFVNSGGSGGLLLSSIRNPLSRCPVVVARRPDISGQPQGQFDDVLWVQLARSYMAMLKLEAAHKAVEAPIALPQDVQHLPIGGNAVMRSSNPEKIRRVSLDVPNTIFAEESALQEEMRLGSRYPEGRSGMTDASIITGKGVQALMGGFDTQVKTAQRIIGEALQDAIGMCFELDEKVWPDGKKKVSGVQHNQPYTLSYTPSRDIKGDYTVDVEYGLLGGLDPNRALVWGLQARSDKLVSRSWMRRNLPVSLNVVAEEQLIDIEDGRDALKQAIAGYVQALPVMAQNGQDPAKIVTSLATVIDARKKGKTIEEAVALAFPAPEPETAPETAAEGGIEEPGQPGGPGMGALGDDGLMRGVAPGQQGEAPNGGRPDLAMMMAGLSAGGAPRMGVTVQRRQAI